MTGPAWRLGNSITGSARVGGVVLLLVLPCPVLHWTRVTPQQDQCPVLLCLNFIRIAHDTFNTILRKHLSLLNRSKTLIQHLYMFLSLRVEVNEG